MVSISDNELQKAIESFNGSSFSTYDIILIIQRLFPSTWKTLVDEYGEGGKGAGKHYSAFSRTSQCLDSFHKHGGLDKLDYRPAPANYGSPIIRYWAVSTSALGGQNYPDELPPNSTVTEGAKQTVIVNKYERDNKARLKCIEKWGIKCSICNFDFEEVYGKRGAGFIHVHHLTPLSEIQKEYQLDPINDLRPVCPNCHAMLHRSIPCITISEVQDMIKSKIKT